MLIEKIIKMKEEKEKKVTQIQKTEVECEKFIEIEAGKNKIATNEKVENDTKST